jgi:AcrR family transcriptional regulator
MGTRERLLFTAERLIARDGVERVSMREINVAAGAKNLSALHYHFDSLEGVISAIFDSRMGPVDHRRNELVAELKARGLSNNIPEILYAVIWPLAEQMLGTGDNNYVGFLAAVNRSPSFDSWQVIGRRNRRGLVRCYVLIRRALVTTPPGVLHTRMVMCVRELVYALADVERMITERHPGSRDTLVVFHASDLVSRIAASLTAPVSEATRMAGLVLEAGASAKKVQLFGMDAIWAISRARTSAA